jgi:hypothetical protein
LLVPKPHSQARPSAPSAALTSGPAVEATFRLVLRCTGHCPCQLSKSTLKTRHTGSACALSRCGAPVRDLQLHFAAAVGAWVSNNLPLWPQRWCRPGLYPGCGRLQELPWAHLMPAPHPFGQACKTQHSL